MNFYYADGDNEVVGPVTDEQLRELYNRGTIRVETNVVPEGSNDWQPYRALRPVPPPPKALIVAAPMRYATQVLPTTIRAVSLTKACPFCAEDVLSAALKCKHCGETLDVALRAAEEANRSRSNHPTVFMNAATAPTIVVSQKRGFPHILHLVVTIFTAGFWLPIWILHYLFRDRRVYD